MTTIQRVTHGAVVALMTVSIGACANSHLGNILGGVLGGTNPSSQLSGTVRNVDSRSQEIAIQTSNGQTVPVSYDNQTQVVYQNQNYSPNALEYGDMVTARVQPAGNTYYTDYVQVDQSVTTNGTLSSDIQLLQGTVRQVDRRNSLFTIYISNSKTITVTLPSDVNSKDRNRFNNLRSGDRVRFYGRYLSNAQIELAQFH
jgi:hypothetical protein